MGSSAAAAQARALLDLEAVTDTINRVDYLMIRQCRADFATQILDVTVDSAVGYLVLGFTKIRGLH